MSTTQTFTKRGIEYVLTAASRPGDRGLDYLQAEFDRCGWTHSIAAKRPNGRKEYMFHAHIDDAGQVVMVSDPF